uniref:Uncharacterized protein n=1 Tax=Microcebus murinus TaxID=30608 RepID=A0A8C5YDP7_MICMU
MPQLSLSWLGLGPAAASPWLLLLLLGASWLLARVLAWACAFHATCRRLRCFPQPPKRSWFWGHQGLVSNNEEGMRLIEDLGHHFRDVHLWWIGPFYPVLRLVHPKFVAPLLQASAAIIPKDRTLYSFLRPWLGDGLLLSAGDKWSRHRRMLTPAFHFDILKPYVQIFNQASGSAVLDNVSHITTSSLAGPCRRPSEYIAATLELSALIMKRHQRVLLHADLLYHLTPDGRRFRRACALVHGFTDAVVRERRRALESQGVDGFLKAKAKSKTLDFIDVLLLAKDEDGKELSDEDIRAEADTFMFGGHDTTASGLSWVLYNLARHPDYQERCRQEVRELLRGREPEDPAPAAFLTCCIKEGLRLHPQATAHSCPQAGTKDVGAHRADGGSPFSVCIIASLGFIHNPSVWPSSLDPATDCLGWVPGASLSHLVRPRNCIGAGPCHGRRMKVGPGAPPCCAFRVLPGHHGAAQGSRKYPAAAEGGLCWRVEALSACS